VHKANLGDAIPSKEKNQGYVHLLEKEGKEKGEQARSNMKAQPTTGPITLHPHHADMFNLELDSIGVSPFFTPTSVAAAPSVHPSILPTNAFCARC
jgi:hypothetical protein